MFSGGGERGRDRGVDPAEADGAGWIAWQVCERAASGVAGGIAAGGGGAEAGWSLSNGIVAGRGGVLDGGPTGGQCGELRGIVPGQSDDFEPGRGAFMGCVAAGAGDGRGASSGAAGVPVVAGAGCGGVTGFSGGRSVVAFRGSAGGAVRGWEQGPSVVSHDRRSFWADWQTNPGKILHTLSFPADTTYRLPKSRSWFAESASLRVLALEPLEE